MKSPRTRSTVFSGIASGTPDLFAVANGIELEPALDAAAVLLEGGIDIAQGVAARISKADGSAELWAAIHALESSAAILEALAGGILAATIEAGETEGAA